MLRSFSIFGGVLQVILERLVLFHPMIFIRFNRGNLMLELLFQTLQIFFPSLMHDMTVFIFETREQSRGRAGRGA